MDWTATGVLALAKTIPGFLTASCNNIEALRATVDYYEHTYVTAPILRVQPEHKPGLANGALGGYATGYNTWTQAVEFIVGFRCTFTLQGGGTPYALRKLRVRESDKRQVL